MDGQFSPVEWITTKEAAELTGYTMDALVKAKNRGELTSIKRGDRLFFQVKDVLEYMRKMIALGTQKHTPRKYLDEELVS